MSKYDEASENYVPLRSDPSSIASGTEINDGDYLSDFEDFNVEEPEYVDKGAKDGYILELSEGMWTKASSKAVRKIIYLFMRWCGYWVLNLKKWIEQYRKRQEDVEKRQTKVENDFKNVISNATTDSEVITARNSDYFGNFALLDERLENIEQLIVGFVPQGVKISVKRTMNALPSIYIDTWEYGIGRVPLGEEPAGKFGGTPPRIVEHRIISWANDELVIQVALDYENFKFNHRPTNDEYLLFDGVRSLMVHVSGGEPVGEAVDKEQVLVSKNKATPTHNSLIQRITQLEERVEGN